MQNRHCRDITAPPTRPALRGCRSWATDHTPQRRFECACDHGPPSRAAFGPGLLPYLFVQAVFGFCLLEVINCTEYYGLLRERTASGRYERCAPRHSWNSDNVATNVFLYHLQRHSDHHADPTRRYQALRHFDEAPELPTGYAGRNGRARPARASRRARRGSGYRTTGHAPTSVPPRRTSR